jgi:transposase
MYPEILKHRAIIHYKEFLPSLRRVAKKYGISKSTLARWAKQGIHHHKKVKRSRKSLHDCIKSTLLSEISNQPFNNASKLVQAIAEKTGTKVSRSTVYRSLSKVGLSYKQAMRCRTHESLNVNHPFLQNPSYEGDAISIDESGFYINDHPGAKGKKSEEN